MTGYIYIYIYICNNCIHSGPHSQIGLKEKKAIVWKTIVIIVDLIHRWLKVKKKAIVWKKTR